MQAGAAKLADRRAGQKSLFDEVDEEDEAASPTVTMPDLPEWDEREKLLYEKEVLGFYLSSHPLAEYERTLRTYCSHTTAELSELSDRTEVMVGGMLSSIKLAHVRKAREGGSTKYANFDLEDIAGNVRCILWPNDFEQYGHLVQADAIIVCRAVVDRRGGGDDVNLVVNELIPLDQLDAKYTRGVMIRVDEGRNGEEGLKQLHEIVRGYPGDTPLQLLLEMRDGSRVVLESKSVRVAVQAELRQRVEGLLGPGNFRLMIAPPKPSNHRSGSNGRQRAG